MSQYQKLLVAIDINAEYKKVIEKALSICESTNDISLVYCPLPMVYINPYLYGVDYGAVDDTDRANRAGERLKDIAIEHGIDTNNLHLKTGGAPADEIKDLANDIGADVIVIGTHGRSGFKLLLGSTANAVLHGVKQDVLAVRVYDED